MKILTYDVDFGEAILYKEVTMKNKKTTPYIQRHLVQSDYNLYRFSGTTMRHDEQGIQKMLDTGTLEDVDDIFYCFMILLHAAFSNDDELKKPLENPSFSIYQDDAKILKKLSEQKGYNLFGEDAVNLIEPANRL